MDKYDYYTLKECVEGNKLLFDTKRIIIMGAGIRGTSISIMLDKLGYTNIAFTDNNTQKVGGCINQYPIIAYEDVVQNKEQEIIIISVEGGYSLIDQLKKDGFIENKDFFYLDNQLYDKYLQKFKILKENLILIMGDCGLTDISPKDKELKNLSEMLEEKLGLERTKVLAIHGMNACAYYHVLSAHIQFVSVPAKVVIIANFETFTGKQHILPRSQHSELIKMLDEFTGHEDKELEGYVKLTAKRFSDFHTDYFTTTENNIVKNNKGKNDRIVMNMNYMYSLSKDNECIFYMKKIISLCKDRGISLLFFIPPVNYMYGEKLWGSSFRQKYDRNLNVLKDIFQEVDVDVLDLSYILCDTEFADISTIDETANYIGRMKVANELVKVI